MTKRIAVVIALVSVLAAIFAITDYPFAESTMSQADTDDQLFIAGLGTFDAQRDNGLLGLYCFERSHTFQGQSVRLVVYPNDNGTWPSEVQRHELVARYKSFDATVEDTLAQLPIKLKPLCEKYGIEIEHLSEKEITSGFRWHNVKLEPSGEIECYTMNDMVSKNLDVVIRFSAPDTIAEVYFDG